MNRPYQRFGFFVESPSAEVSDARSPLWASNGARRPTGHQPPLRWAEFPADGPVFLIGGPAGLPSLVSELPDPMTLVAALEPAAFDRQAFVLMLIPPGGTVRVNGVTAPMVTALHVADQVEWDASTVLHLSQYRRPYLGPARTEDIGNECPVCRFRFAEQTVVLVCVHCGLALHCETQPTVGDAPLECARLSTECPRCAQRLVEEEGYAYVPQL